MFIKIKNENYGYVITTYGDYVVVSNPAITRYNAVSASDFHTGSFDYFRYNKATDEHDYIGTLYRPLVDIDVLLTTELNGSAIPTASLTTEVNFSSQSYLGLLIDKNNYTASVEDGFGLSLDMYNKQLIVGCPYYTQHVQTSMSVITASAAAVFIYDLGITEYLSFTSSTTPLIYTISDPDIGNSNWNSGSFGIGVSINKDWLAIGSPRISGSNGMVYIYKNNSTGNTYDWSLYQKIEASGSISAAEFGNDLKLNKHSGSTTPSLVVGAGNIYNKQAYYFEFLSGSWQQVYVFQPDDSLYPMTFGNYFPYETNPTNIGNGFGTSVSTYGDVVIIGEPYDRTFHEYSGSTEYQQGSIYIFEKCSTSRSSSVYFDQVFKSYGNINTLKNNRAGFSVDIFGNNAIAGIPRTNVLTMTSCYIGGTLEQLHYCNSDLENALNGQVMLIQKNTASLQWEITNVYQKKKKYLSPYRSYGFDVAIADKSMVVGSPMYIQDANRNINITTTQSNNVFIDDVCGKSYIYNLNNLRNEFHVGNVFYRNGKIVIMTSGSVFDGLFFNPVNTIDYEYDLTFKSQHTIFEKQIVCSVDPGEFNVSTNPTAIVRITASLDINQNGKFDFQDVDVILRYMQYKNSSYLGIPISTDWSSSIVINDDERSLYKWYLRNYDNCGTSKLTSESIIRWETTDTWMQQLLDLNNDNRIDVRDMNIMWKYFSNRLTQENYATYITPSSKRKLFSDVIDYLDSNSHKNSTPLILPEFSNYERMVMFDKTGSYLAPMVTTIGLYSGLDLVAVAKLGNPMKITPELPINFVVKMDF